MEKESVFQTMISAILDEKLEKHSIETGVNYNTITAANLDNKSVKKDIAYIDISSQRERYFNGEITLQDAVSELITMINETGKDEIEHQIGYDAKKILEKVKYIIVNEKNAEIIKEKSCIYKHKGDMIAAPVVIDEDSSYQVITKELLKELKIDLGFFDATVIKNTLDGICFRIKPFSHGSTSIFVLENEDETKKYGSVGLLLPELMQIIYNAIGGDFLLLPLSVHRVICIKSDDWTSDFTQMLIRPFMQEEIKKIKSEERLSDMLYGYRDGMEDFILIR